MWDDENDKKLRDAADNFQPAPDENAWQTMEKMLDENLPQKKDMKRILFFLPFILILAGFVFFIFFYNKSNSNFQQAKIPANAPVNSNSLKGTHIDEKKIPPFNSHANSTDKTMVTSVSDNAKNKTVVPVENVKVAKEFTHDQNGNKNINLIISSEEEEKKSLNNGENLEGSKPTNMADSVSANNDVTKINNSKVEEKQQAEKNIPAATPKTNEIKPNQKSRKQKEKNKNKFSDNFSLGLSAGPGVSAVGSNEGKLTLDLGIIAGYHFAKHFGIRTGMFISKKIYSATPAEYTLPAGSSYYYLQKINANCNVIDIPLIVDYHFNQKGKQGWFVSAGLSSYLMKKESYEYFYKTPTGQTYNKDWSISNQNKHFFSILDLSVGYQYLLNEHFSLAAQPYLDLPLTGIGAGKVKLNSAGILFTIQAKPFLKKKK